MAETFEHADDGDEEAGKPRGYVTAVLREWIEKGQIGRDEPLPSERELARRLGVGRNAVRRALRTLTADGVIARSGARERVITPGALPRSSWMKRSIAFVDPLSGQFEDDVRRWWLEYVSLGMVDAIREAGLHSIALNTESFAGEDVERLCADPPLGVLIPGDWHRQKHTIGGGGYAGNEELLPTLVRLRRAGVPVVVYGGDDSLVEFDRVRSDHDAGGYELVKKLVSMGRRRLVCAWTPPLETYWLKGRERGGIRAAIELGVNLPRVVEVPSAPVLEGVPTVERRSVFERAARAMAAALERELTGPEAADAIMATSDRAVSVVAAACRLLHRVPGRDVLVCGYDNYFQWLVELDYEPSLPALTVDKRNDAMGRAMVALLMDRLAGKFPGGGATRSVVPEVVVPGA